jgi:hypothetical protein
MYRILAQINWQETGTVVVAVIAALGGQRGLESLIVAWRGKRATSRPNGEGNGKYVTEQMCLLRHTEQEKLQNARHLAVTQGLRDLKDNVQRIHERIDDMANHKD